MDFDELLDFIDLKLKDNIKEIDYINLMNIIGKIALKQNDKQENKDEEEDEEVEEYNDIYMSY